MQKWGNRSLSSSGKQFIKIQQKRLNDAVNILTMVVVVNNLLKLKKKGLFFVQKLLINIQVQSVDILYVQ